MNSESAVRDAMGMTMQATLTDQTAHQNWLYLAIRPLPLLGARGHYPAGTQIRSDCSWGARLIAWWTPGTPDPMGSGFQGSGNSSTICARLDHLDHPSELMVGDPVTFGWNGNEHAAVCLEEGADPLLWSDGHPGAPNTYRLSYDRRPHQLLRLPVVDKPPTPDELLRGKTGYWAWVQWRLGEGSWRHKKPVDPVVRPAVPKLVSPGWWVKYAQFLAGREKPNKPKGPK